MKLYHHPASHNARRVVALAKHVNAPVELVLVDLVTGAHRTDAFRAINPNGKVPALVDGELKLWESTAILAYLAAVTDSPLLPKGAADRADVDRWLAWTTGRLGSKTDVFLFENVVRGIFGLGPANPAALEAARPEVEACFALLDAHLASQPYLARFGLSIADFALFPTIDSATSWGLPSLEGYPALRRWAVAVGGLEGFRG
jgi:glutathione S-transferase